MKKLLLIPVLYLLISCNPKSGNNSTTETVQKKTDTAATKKPVIKIKKGDAIIKSPKKLIGIWADSVGGNAVFQIDKKTFF
ncbi:MAG: hypothetical protein ABIN13_00665 [Mucilaginibacter sp.]